MLKDGWQFIQKNPDQAVQTSLQPENPHYATNPDIRQTTPLQETTPVQTVADQPQKPATPPADDEWGTPFQARLNVILSTLQLQPPMATATVVESWNRPLNTPKN
jgi:hypothetical protein